MNQLLTTMLLVAALLATYTPQAAHAAPTRGTAPEGCYITTLQNGQYVVQTGGKTGTLNAYVNEKYATTIQKIGQPWYITKKKSDRVAVYNNKLKRVC